MELTPGEQMILGQLRQLYSSTSRRDHPLGTITRQWPAMQVEAYRGVLGSLLSKGLVEITGHGQSMRITDAGLRAMGLGQAAATKPPDAAASRQHQALKTRRLSLVGHLVFIAAAAAAIVLLWLVLWPR